MPDYTMGYKRDNSIALLSLIKAMEPRLVEAAGEA